MTVMFVTSVTSVTYVTSVISVTYATNVTNVTFTAHRATTRIAPSFGRLKPGALHPLALFGCRLRQLL